MPEAEDLRGTTPVHLTATFRGVALPAPLAVIGALAFLASIATLLLVLVVGGSLLREIKTEMRVLQIHVQDVENVLIRSGSATRSDFAPWPEQEAQKGKSDGRD